MELFKIGYQKFPVGYLWGSKRSGALSRPFADVVASIGSLKPEERRSASTVNTALSYLSTIAKFLARTAWHPKTPNTTVLDFSAARVSRREDGVDPRPPWTRHHMETMFSSPVYIGGGYGKERFVPTDNPVVFHDAAYFAPLFWYYIQACRDEICGLAVDDIFTEGEIPYFIIRNNLIRGYDGGMSGEKRVARRRALPIHPEILRLGFLEYVQSIRAEGHKALFPELYTNPTKRGGHHFYEIAWYHIFTWIHSQRSAPISPKGKMSDIHSIRSLGSSFYELDGVNEIIRSDIMGHSRPGINGKHYSKRISTEGVAIVISERLDFIIKYIPNITADVPSRPINLLPLDLRSRLGVRTVRKMLT